MKYTKLRRYQEVGVAHLLRQPHGGLLMDPGTGKTLVQLAAFHELSRRRLVDRMLVVGPLNAVYDVWPAEVQKWGFPYQVDVLHGDRKDHTLATSNAAIWCVNYEGLDWLFSSLAPSFWRSGRWWIVADEATKIKHTNTQRFKILKPHLPSFARRTALTGTPAPNGLEDLFGIVYFCDLGHRLGRYITQYRRQYFYPSGYNGYDYRIQPDGEARIWKQLDGLFYRVSDDVLGLKALERAPIHVRLPPKARKVYETLEREFVADLESGRVKAVNAGVLTHKLRQVANGFLYDDGKVGHDIHNAKLDALEGLVDELNGNPLLVGYEFRHEGELIADRFNAPMVGGGTPKKESSRIFAEFNQGKHPVVAAQMAANAHALNLQAACHHVAMFGQIWDLEVYEQFYKRVRRGGQRRTVFLHEIMAKGTVDVDINRQVVTGRGSKKVRQDRLLRAIVERYGS